MKIQEAVSFICEFAKKEVEAFDVIASTSHSEGLSVFQGQVQNTEISDSVGLGIRVIKDGRPGYAHTERFSKEALQQTVKDAICHTEWTEPIQIELPENQNIKDNGFNYNPELENLDLMTLKNFCIDLEKATFEKSNEIENIPYLGADLSNGYSMIANHKGLCYDVKSNCVSVGVGAVASRNGIKKLGNYVKAGRNWNSFIVDELASKSAEYAVELFGAQKIEGGKIPVILSERVAGQFLSMYTQPFIAEAMQKGQSKLKDKEGEKIATDVFSLASDPQGLDFEHRMLFDSEGSLTRRVNVVKNGIFQEALYNLETAAKANRATTGSATRGFGTKMSTSFGNILVPTSEKNLDDLIKLFPKCLLVLRLEGNTGCNAISGQLSIGAHGIWCENGAQIHPVDGVTLSGNFFEILNNIVAVGNVYRDNFSAVKVPALAIEELFVSL